MRKLLVVLLSMTVAACAATIRPDVAVTYVAPERLVVERVAILPVTAGEGLEGFRRMTADSLYSALVRARPELKVIPADSTLELLNDIGLARRYSEMVIAYGETGILDRETLAAMGDALGVGYLLHVEVGYDAGRSTDYSIWTGFETKRRQRLTIFAHLWSPAVGDVVWEAAGGARVEAHELETTRSIPEILEVVCRELAAAFPSGPLTTSGDAQG